MRCSASFRVLLAVVCLGFPTVVHQTAGQDLGHRLPGLIGLDAGRTPPAGLYLIDRFVTYDANQLRDRRGVRVPDIDFRLLAQANAVGVSYTIGWAQGSRTFTMTLGAPLARLSTNVPDRPEVSLDRHSFGDVYIQPARLGWRYARADLLVAYALYVPTGLSPLAGGRGLSAGHLTNQFSAGGSIYTNREKSFFLTALASYAINGRKRNIDITRGDILLVQGGAGISLRSGGIEAGLAFNGLWQLRDDSGSDLPAVLLGARDRVYGLGPEVAWRVKPIRSQVRVRYERDIAVRSRPKGFIFVVGVNIALRRPQAQASRSLN